MKQTVRWNVAIFGLVITLPAGAELVEGYDTAWGIMCLDGATGRPMWEFFPDEPGAPLLAEENGTLWLIHAPENNRPNEDGTWSRTFARAYALEPATGTMRRRATASEAARLLRLVDREDVPAASGDRVVGEAGRDRVITVMRGSTNEPRLTIPTVARYESVFVIGAVIVYAPQLERNIAGAIAEGPRLVAVDGENGGHLWTLDDAGDRLGVAAGTRAIYFCEPQAIRAQDPRMGRVHWRRHLPRIRGYSSIREQGDSVFVDCDSLGTEVRRPRYLYCLDCAIGAVRWEYEPDDSSFAPRLYLANGNVIAQVAPSHLLGNWGVGFGPMPGYEDVPVKRWRARVAEELSNRFASLAPDEIALRLRAWHALGDGAGMYMLGVAKEVLRDTPLRALSDELLRSFPRVRNATALLDFLEESFDRNPELHGEVGRILRDSYLIPWWYKTKTLGYNRPVPQYVPFAERQALMDRYEAFCARAATTPMRRITTAALADLTFGRAVATFDDLVAAHDGSNDPDFRHSVRLALIVQHPTTGSDWALTNLELFSTGELAQWIQRAPLDWLVAHEEVYLGWLRSGDSSLQSAAAYRLTSAPDAALILPFCVKLLEEDSAQCAAGGWSAIRDALRVLGRSGRMEFVPLIQRFAAESEGDEVSDPVRAAKSGIREEALQALEALGAPVVRPAPRINAPAPAVPLPISKPEPITPFSLQKALAEAVESGQAHAAKAAAQAILDHAARHPQDWAEHHRPLAEACLILEEWDRAIEELRLSTDGAPFFVEVEVLHILAKAGRIDEIVNLVEQTADGDHAVVGGYLLLGFNRWESAGRAFEKGTRKNPNDPDAHIGLALVHWQRGETERADALMERAIALRPNPYDEGFRQSILYWINRGQPEKAVAWIRESLRVDRKAWEQSGLLEWARSQPELKATVEASLREAPTGH